RDVDRNIDRRLQRTDEEPALDTLAAAVLDQLPAAAGEARDRAQVAARERELGARQVVLGKTADALEERAAGGVVEVLRREGLLRLRKTRDDVVAEAAC